MVDYNNDKIVSNAAHQFFACWRETYSHYLQYLQGVHVFKTVGRKFANLVIPEISMQKRRFMNKKKNIIIIIFSSSELSKERNIMT